MSRRRNRERGTKPAVAPPPRPQRRLPRRVLWMGLALLAAIALSWSVTHRPSRRSAPEAAGAPEPEAIARMSADDALRTALALGQAAREAESLPYYRHAIRYGRGDIWQARYNYATALYNTTLRIESRNGLPAAALRSSWERIAFVREAVRQLTLADGLTRTPQDRATVRAAYGQMLVLWGLPWDALLAYRQASAANPANRDLAMRGDGLMNLMRAPIAGGIATRR